ncbi:hypothetical protein [Eupransor demetentiae]|uniref:DUF3278 domain-containing protein n=1 Tax=Eupransor demetentiae TaxID=3109584 RepID=A0ABP0EME2_9LACO|nr:hypothetical protein R54876_GBNLAHCA_00021 [Lactobacillaceae bacterium LMG 33000]
MLKYLFISVNPSVTNNQYRKILVMRYSLIAAFCAIFYATIFVFADVSKAAKLGLLTGFITAFLVIAVFYLLLYLNIKKHPDKLQQAKIKESDERVQLNNTRAAKIGFVAFEALSLLLMAYFYCVANLKAGILISGVITIASAIYLLSYLLLNKFS